MAWQCDGMPVVRTLQGDDGSMRKGTRLFLGAGAGALAVGAVIAVNWRRRGIAGPATGTFSNGAGYARLGTGAKSLLWIGGPSVGAPGGVYLTMMARVLRPFVQKGYTVGSWA